VSLRKRCSPRVSATVADGRVNPLHCPSSPRCDHYWHYDFRVNGVRCRASTDTSDKSQARDIEARERARILEGQHGIRRDSPIMFKEFAKLYLETHSRVVKRPSTAKRDAQTIRILERFFGSQRLKDITQFGIEQFRARRLADGVTPATVNRQYFVLSNMFRMAIEWGKLRTSPMARMKRLKVLKPGRDRILTPEEQSALLQAYTVGRRIHVRPIILLLLVTGARLSEILTLRWSDVGERDLTLYKTKNGRLRQLPLTDNLRAVFNGLPRHGEFVFPSFRTPGKPYRRILNGFRAALKDAGITDPMVCLHSLRHTALSRMVAAGMDLRTVMDVSGHSRLEELTRYTHPNEAAKAAALATFQLPMGTTRSQRAKVLRHKTP
jgi:integrase